MNFPPQLTAIAEQFEHRLVFATVSGAHLYGFPSPDSDFDLRGCHVLPLERYVSLVEPDETEERMAPEDDIDLDLVSHDVRKFCRMLLRPNGYVLEQLLSPWVIATSPEHEEMCALAPQLVTRHHSHHYLGFARNQWDMFCKQPRTKTLLYVYRTLLTGIHLMRTGTLEASLPKLLEAMPQPGVDDLIASKLSGAEKQDLAPAAIAEHRQRYECLTADLQAAREATKLAEKPTAFAALNAIVMQLRLTTREN